MGMMEGAALLLLLAGGDGVAGQLMPPSMEDNVTVSKGTTSNVTTSNDGERGRPCTADWECDVGAGQLCNLERSECGNQACSANSDCTYYTDQYCEEALGECHWIYFMGMAPRAEPMEPAEEPQPGERPGL
eukprot:COSAG02_NODE_936_length_15800_cov_56.762945_11_plen_131_part_00